MVDPLVDVAGDEASVAAYWLLLERHDGDGTPVIAAFGRYRDRLVRSPADGRWRIADRFAEVEATNAGAPVAGPRAEDGR